MSSLVLDSRQVEEGSLFVAIPGKKIDGRNYIGDALKRGCVAVVVEDITGLEDSALPLVLVADAHQALGELAAAFYDYPANDLQLIGITGTNGKTTTSWLIEGMLLSAGGRPGVIVRSITATNGRDGLRIIQDAPLTTPDAITLQRLLRDHGR